MVRRVRSIHRVRRVRWRLLVLVAYLVAAVGFPMPAGPISHELYPCRGRPCGCKSAFECWTGCCCFSAEERVLWALAHDVAIPDYAVLPPPDVMDRLLQTPIGQAVESRSLAHRCQSNGCCETQNPTRKDEAADTCCPDPTDDRFPALVLAMLAAKCKGGSAGWQFLAPAPLPAHCEWNPGFAVIRSAGPFDVRWTGRRAAPPVPPPRFLHDSV